MRKALGVSSYCLLMAAREGEAAVDVEESDN